MSNALPLLRAVRERTFTDDEVAAHFGTKWAQSFTRPRGGKARASMRRQFQRRSILAAVKAAGGRCDNCKHSCPTRYHTGLQCDLQSDNDGDVYVDQGHACADWDPTHTHADIIARLDEAIEREEGT